jgi:hypothetical protein
VAAVSAEGEGEEEREGGRDEAAMCSAEREMGGAAEGEGVKKARVSQRIYTTNHYWA